MTDVLLFHHALGLTDGVRAYADRLREAGHRVTTPDLFEGRIFDEIQPGVEHAQELSFEMIIERGVHSADGLGPDLVVSGFSLGALPAQKLAQTRAGVIGAILYHSAVPVTMFGERWPKGVPLQLHFVEGDEWSGEDFEVGQALAEDIGAELYTYQAKGHLVADSSFHEYDADVAAAMLAHTLDFLATLG
jgi:dienelactone hydrolase